MSWQTGPGFEPAPSALKASALPIELTWQRKSSTNISDSIHLQSSRACAIDGLAVEHFIHDHSITNAFFCYLMFLFHMDIIHLILL